MNSFAVTVSTSTDLESSTLDDIVSLFTDNGCHVIYVREMANKWHGHLGVLTPKPTTTSNFGKYWKQQLTKLNPEVFPKENGRVWWKCTPWYVGGDGYTPKYPNGVPTTINTWEGYLSKDGPYNESDEWPFDWAETREEHLVPNIDPKDQKDKVVSAWHVQVQGFFITHDLPFGTYEEVSSGLSTLMNKLQVIKVIDIHRLRAKVLECWCFFNKFDGCMIEAGMRFSTTYKHKLANIEQELEPPPKRMHLQDITNTGDVPCLMHGS